MSKRLVAEFKVIVTRSWDIGACGDNPQQDLQPKVCKHSQKALRSSINGKRPDERHPI